MWIFRGFHTPASTCRDLELRQGLALSWIWQGAHTQAWESSLPSQPWASPTSRTFLQRCEVTFPYNLSQSLFLLLCPVCFPTDHPALNHRDAEARGVLGWWELGDQGCWSCSPPGWGRCYRLSILAGGTGSDWGLAKGFGTEAFGVRTGADAVQQLCLDVDRG